MSVGRKLSEPVYVEDAYGRPTPVPVLLNEHRAAEVGGQFHTSSLDEQVTPVETPYDGVGVRYIGSAFKTYYDRVYVIPRALALVDPENGDPNPFYLWNASFDTVILTSIASEDDIGLELGFDVGLSLRDIELKQVFVTVTPAAPVAEEAHYLFGFDSGFITPFIINLLRTNLLITPPETPVMEKLEWKTNILTARDGTEQRFGVRQLHRQTLNYKMVYSNEDEEREVYRQFFARGGETFSVPIWHTPIRLAAAATAGQTQVLIDTTRYDIQTNDQLYIEHDDGTYEIVRVQNVGLDNLTIPLYTSLLADVALNQRIYRVTTVYLPGTPSIKRGAFQDVQTDLELRVTEAREMFVGTAAPQEIGQTTTLGDRVLNSTVYTLGGVPILHGRPIVKGSVEESFNWNYEVTDYETGVFEQTTPQDKASVSYDRTFHTKYSYQDFFYSWIMRFCHGQRKPLWMPTWQYEIADRVDAISGFTVTVGDEQYANDYPADSSHRGLWVRWNGRWLARRITAVEKDGEGNSLISVEPAFPIDFPTEGPYEVGFLVLARLGSDEVQIEHRPAYSFVNMKITSTNSTSQGV